MGMTSRQFDTLRDLIYKSLGLFFEDENEPVELNHPIVTTFQLSA